MGKQSLVLAAMAILSGVGWSQQTRQATGVKVGEVTDTSAIVWMRHTAEETRNSKGLLRRGRPAGPLPDNVKVDDLEGACAGAAGQVRLRYGIRDDLGDGRSTGWVEVKEANDFAHAFRLTGLQPGTIYHFAAETAGPGGKPEQGTLRGRFETAPSARQSAEVSFTVVTGQAYKDLDHKDGFHIYEAMARLKPKFLVPTGDTVYYDSEDPRATTPALARYHWHRMYSLPRHVAFHLRVPGYWMKDDHDTLSDDCWSTLNPRFMLPLTFEEGQRLFREQVPMSAKTFRTFRWGKDLQVWLVEGRDFRSPNTMKDGPDKTIWGAEQKKWLKETLLASDATWKVLLSPTPIVGPDRAKGKNDNHSNAAFQHEGDEMRQWFARHLPDNFFIACGDRHWQYHSVHPETKVQEFSCGPASDEHASGSPGEDRQYHRFHRVKGGFLSVSVSQQEGKARIAFRFHDVQGKQVYQFTKER